MHRVQSKLLDFLRFMGGRRRRDGGFTLFALFFPSTIFGIYISS